MCPFNCIAAKKNGSDATAPTFTGFNLQLSQAYPTFDIGCTKLFYTISADLGLLRTVMWNGYEQGVAFRNKKAGARAVRRVDLYKGFIGVCIRLLDDVDLSSTTDGIDAAALAVVENIIGIAGDVDLYNNVARIFPPQFA